MAGSGRAASRRAVTRAVAHPNIAIAKYWGKKAVSGNIPAVPSLSVTLAGMTTTTDVELRANASRDSLALDGHEATGEALTRAAALLDRVRRRAGSKIFARVTSANDFPTASGLASSASGFAALALAATRAYGLEIDAAEVASLARES
ncbi:MAG: diphosphomevalonate decarboxylase, partial [Polyangiaceae bacterium]